MANGVMVSAIDLAWAAGFLDGEACIHIARVKRNCGHGVNYRLRLYVSQNCLHTLVRLQQIFGGMGYIRQVRRRLQHTRQIYTYSLDGRSAIEAIRAVWPYLYRKRAEADVALAFYEDGDISLHPGPKGTSPAIWAFRKWCYDKLRKMK